MTNPKHHDEEEFADRIDWTKAQQGAKHPLPPGKERITIRLDEDVLAWFRNQVAETGGLYQTKINEVLRAHMLGKTGEFEAMLRKAVRAMREVVRTELASAGTAPGKTRGSTKATAARKATTTKPRRKRKAS